MKTRDGREKREEETKEEDQAVKKVTDEVEYDVLSESESDSDDEEGIVDALLARYTM